MVIKKEAALRIGGVVAALAVAVSPVLASAAVDTDTTTITATVAETISMSTLNNVALGLTPGSQPVRSIGIDTVTVTTNAPDGYNMTLSNSDASTHLLSGEGAQIPAHAGTYAAPTTLADNTWGYALANVSAFDGSYTTGDNQLGSTAKFAGVPALGSAQQIANTNLPGVDTTDIYYGVQVNGTQQAGAYTDSVIYTATTNN